MKKKIFCFLLATSLITSNIAVNAASFYDIGDAPWAGAATYINKVADLGIMVGSDDLKGRKVFKPKENVTYCETAQLVYSLLKTTGQLKSGTNYKTQYSAVMTSNKIPTWAQEAVGYCLGEGYLTISDLAGFMDSKGKDIKATRENVAVMFGNSLKTLSAGSSATVFKDASSISAAALTQVNHLASLGILTGDTDGNFNPKNAINRAEMAVMVTKAYELIDSQGGAKTGIISAIEDFGTSVFITVGIGGSSKGFYLSDNVIVTKGTTALTTKDLGIYDTIEIDYDGATVNSINITDDFQVDSPSSSTDKDTEDDDYEKKGTMTKITTSVIEIDDDDEYDLADKDDLTIKLNGKTVDIDDLKDAYNDYDEVEVTITLNDDDEVTKIVATGDDDDYDETGTITDLTTRIIELDDDDEWDLIDTEDLTIKIDGDTSDFGDLEDAYDDYDEVEVKLTLNSDDEVTKIIATTSDDSDDDEVKGAVKTLDDTDEIKVGNTTYDISSSVDVDVDDGTDKTITDIDDLVEAYDEDGKQMYVTLTIKSNKVTDIEGYVTGITEDCDLQSVYASSDEIKVKCVSGTSVTYEVDDDCDIEIDGEDGYSITGLETKYREYDLIITDMEFDSSGYVTSITADLD